MDKIITVSGVDFPIKENQDKNYFDGKSYFEKLDDLTSEVRKAILKNSKIQFELKNHEFKTNIKIDKDLEEKVIHTLKVALGPFTNYETY